MDRREFLEMSAGAAAATALLGCREDSGPRWTPEAVSKGPSSRVAVLRAEGYDAPLREILLQGLRLFPLEVGGRRVVLKPNLVEFEREGVINTHPSLVAAAIEAFRSLGAAEVVVAEGPGHRRDDEHLLEASGLGYILRETGARYVDLNHDAVRPVRLRSRYTELDRLYLPRTVLEADLLVSMPKLKTHHWAGVTLSLKNMFGIVPGAVYGWPKNLLHWQGIANSILDINAALEVPRFNIVDGIVGMDGNGPIQGEPRSSGVLVLGGDPVAVDATGARLMTIDPGRLGYLAHAGRFLGNVEPERIRQVGEDPGRLRQDYRVLEPFEGIKIPSEATGS